MTACGASCAAFVSVEPLLVQLCGILEGNLANVFREVVVRLSGRALFMSRRSLRILASLAAQRALREAAEEPLLFDETATGESDVCAESVVSKSELPLDVEQSQSSVFVPHSPTPSITTLDRKQTPVEPAGRGAAVQTVKVGSVRAKPSAHAGQAAEASWADALMGWVFDPNLLLIAACLVAVIVFIPKALRLFPDLRSRADYRVSIRRIEIIPPLPHWVPHNLVEQAARQAGLPDELSLLDDGVAQRVAAAFERHPWVRGAVRVRASVPARLQVELEYREPVAMVRVRHAGRDGLFPIDAEGVILPSADFPPSQIEKYPVIEHVKSSPSGPAGTAWRDLNVLGAAQLAVMLRPFWSEFQLKSILVETRAAKPAAWDDLSFRLTTAGGSRIIWGRPPGSRHPGELPSEKKLERMKFYVRHHGPFDSSHGPCEFDITHWRDISRKPIAEQSRPTRNRL